MDCPYLFLYFTTSYNTKSKPKAAILSMFSPFHGENRGSIPLGRTNETERLPQFDNLERTLCWKIETVFRGDAAGAIGETGT